MQKDHSFMNSRCHIMICRCHIMLSMNPGALHQHRISGRVAADTCDGPCHGDEVERIDRPVAALHEQHREALVEAAAREADRLRRRRWHQVQPPARGGEAVHDGRTPRGLRQMWNFSNVLSWSSTGLRVALRTTASQARF